MQDILNCAISQVGNPWLNVETECHSTESDLDDQLKTEAVNMVGLTFRYYVVEGSDPVLFHGLQLKTIQRVFKIKMSMADLPGQNRIAGLMGLFDDSNQTGIVTMKHWRPASTYGANFENPGTFPALKAPRIGDILYSEANGLLYDVIYINTTDNQFQWKSHVFSIGFKPFENKQYEIGNEIVVDDPIRGILKNIDPETGVETDKESIFTVPQEVIDKNARPYVPDDVELPPNNDKDNPFPRF